MPSESVKLRGLKAVPDLPDLTDDPVCEICFGSGMEIIPGKGARVCECRQKAGHASIYEKARIPTRYLDCDFTTFQVLDRQTGLVDPYLERAHDKALKFLKTYPKVNQGLLFSGPVGVGKTHLAVSIIKGLMDRNYSNCLFYEFGWLVKEIQDSYNPNTQSSELKLLHRVISAEVLVLDELGSSKPTEWVKDTLMNIINTRYNNCKMTIFTTNYLDEEYTSIIVDRKYVQEQILKREGTPDSIESIRSRFEKMTFQEWERLIAKEKLKLQVSDESLTERIGYRLRSRLYEMCEEVYIGSDDFRRQYRKSSRS